MKRFLALCALAAGCAFAQTRYSYWLLTGTGTTTSVNTDSTNHTLQVVVTGSPSACTVRLEGSLDNNNWFDISGTQTCTSAIMFHVYGRRVSYVRANLLTWTGGTNAGITYTGAN